jgi:hypothetical protein
MTHPFVISNKGKLIKNHDFATVLIKLYDIQVAINNFQIAESCPKINESTK